MDLIHLDKTIIAAVAQRPFSSGFNTFCKLVPVFDHLDRVDQTLSEKDFYNDGEIWWRISSSNYARLVVPGTLMEIRLERSPGADERDGDKSLYQAHFDGPEGVLGGKCGAEIFRFDGEREDLLSKFKGDGDWTTLPHVPSRQVFFRVAGYVYGPFATELKDFEDDGCQATVSVKPFRDDLKVFKLAEADFNRNYRVLKASKDVSLNQVSRNESGSKETVSWAYLPSAECSKAENDFATSWQELDFEPLSAKLAKVVRSVEGFTRTERQQARRLVERLEQAVTKVEDPDKIREAVSGIGDATRSYEQSIREVAKVLMENGLLSEERLKEAEKDYLERWIGTQSGQINAAIAAKQRELDELTQQVIDEKAKFELELKRREKELQDKEDKALETLATLERENMASIQSEKDNWNAERDRLKREFDDKEKRISAMLQDIRGATEKQAAEIIGVYPFLENIRVGGGTAEPNQPAAPKTDEPAEFPVPALLKSGCKGARIVIDQRVFMRQLANLAQSRGFNYDPDDLRRFHTSVLCEGLTILAGPSGVGKSSLARLYGEALSGGEESPRNGTHVVHVSPTWMERSDLLGFVNTVTGEFSPSETGLYQRLIYAEEDYKANGGDSALYPICLDEMNLSQIEHYFNDFMQLLEQPHAERVLPCFSPEAVRSDSAFAKFASIRLAPSLRFIGTVNFDETTRCMSMRLLDRVNLIRLSEMPISGLPGNTEGMDAIQGISNATYSSWIKTENLSPAAEKCLQELVPFLKCLGVGVSPRVREGMKRYIASSKPLIDSANPELIAFDEQIAQRVLGKIRSLSSDRQEDALGDVEKILSDYCGASMKQSSRVIDDLRDLGRPFGFRNEDED